MGELYRAKQINSGKWIEGFLIRQKEKYYISTNPYQLMDGYSSKNGQHYGFGDFYEVDTKTVCQYTGCLNTDIKKIFVNDIVGVDDIIGVVKFGKYGNGFHLGYYIEWINSEFRQELGLWDGKVKHIGNVFDNPKLIKW